MKFKDNIFYKAYEFKEKSDDFEHKRMGDDKIDYKVYFYDLDVGVSKILARLLELDLNYNRDEVGIEVHFEDEDDFDYELRNKVYSPNEALELLKDREVKDLKNISFIRNYPTVYFSDNFYIDLEASEVRHSKTNHDKTEDTSFPDSHYDPYDDFY